MSDSQADFTGRWLHDGDWKDKDFTNALPDYDHDEAPGTEGTTAMRHTIVESRNGPVAVWIPSHWSDQQACEALEENW